MLETLDYTIRIGSTPIILYFDFYLYSALQKKLFLREENVKNKNTRLYVWPINTQFLRKQKLSHFIEYWN